MHLISCNQYFTIFNRCISWEENIPSLMGYSLTYQKKIFCTTWQIKTAVDIIYLKYIPCLFPVIIIHCLQQGFTEYSFLGRRFYSHSSDQQQLAAESKLYACFVHYVFGQINTYLSVFAQIVQIAFSVQPQFIGLLLLAVTKFIACRHAHSPNNQCGQFLLNN